jgi:hypothetical protein
VTHRAATDTDGTAHRFRFINNVAINENHADVRVNVIDYREEAPGGTKRHLIRGIVEIC